MVTTVKQRMEEAGLYVEGKRAELEDFRCSSQENASGNAPDSVFSSWGKKRSPDGFFPLLRIGHKSFDLRVSCSEDFNPHSWHAP